MTAAVRLSGLTRRFGDLTAVDGLSFEVRRGELFGIVGPDGAGKTTTLRILAGVLPPTSGDAEILGIGVARDPEGVKPHLAYMSQRFGLYEDLTVRENIEFYADLYRVPCRDRPARLERLYRFSHLGEFQDRLAGALSGGMKQKLSLCCALIHHPEVLLLDEPTFGVDPISRRDLWLILHEMVADGVTVIVTTSYLDEAERCDRVALLDRGRVLGLDSPAALQRTLAGALYAVRAAEPRRARDVLRSAPAVRRASLFGETIHVVVDASAVEAATVAPPGPMRAIGDVAAPVAGPDPATRLRHVLETAGQRVLSVEPIEPSLEDVFIDRVTPASGSIAGVGAPAAGAVGAGPARAPAGGRDG